MAEAGKRRAELDEALFAVGVDLADVRACKRRAALADQRMPREFEGMLDIELKVVDLERSQLVDEPEKPVDARHAAARHIQAQPAHGKVGPVFDFAAGEAFGPGLAQKLLQGLV